MNACLTKQQRKIHLNMELSFFAARARRDRIRPSDCGKGVNAMLYERCPEVLRLNGTGVWLCAARVRRQHSPSGNRRGVLLLIALIVLTLFMLLGTTYMIVATKRKACSVTIGSAGAQSVTVGKDTADHTFGDVLVGDPSGGASRDGIGQTSSARISKYLVSAILLDKYGDRYDTMTFDSGSAIPASGGTSASGFFKLTLTSTAAQQIGAPYAGRIVMLDETNAVFRIIASSSSAGTQTFIAHPVNPTASISLSGSSPSIDKPAYIQGREFSGDASDSDDLHESYDAPDGRNWFLSWVQTDGVLGRNQIPGDADDPTEGWKYVIPSFHRPDRLLRELKASGAGFYNSWLDSSAITLLRPAGRMTFDPGTDWAALGLASLPAMPSGTALEHPNFTGSNERIVSGTRCYFDPINGPWDVDNDGDGVTDSIWLDVGMPTVELGPTRTPCKPLVALMITDLDSRINVNAHGSNARNLFGFSPFALNSGTATGIYYAGTSLSGTTADGSLAPRRASLSRGQGWGVAEIDNVHAFPAASSLFQQGLLHGTASTGVGYTPRGVIAPDVKVEGRYGDSVALSGPLAPAPGRLNLADPSVDDELATEPRDKHIPDKFGSPAPEDTRRHTAGSPIDVWGNLQIGIDQMGQPFFSRYATTSGTGWPLTWANDRVDDPYDISLGRTAPRPGWSYDPVVTATSSTPSSIQDNVFTAAHLERLLRLFEPSASRLSPRLASLFGSSAEMARLTATTDSWDSTAICAPLKVFKPLLELSDQMDASKPSLVSWDLQMGLRMDINRPFGDGLDNTDPAYPGFGVADEPGEEVPASNPSDPTQLMLAKGLTNGRDSDGDGYVTLADQTHARQLFARHLFVLAMKTAPSSLTGSSLAAFRKEAAQWAVNVVDYRDPDSIMTRFRFDDTFDKNSVAWQITASSPEVWGCERPETLITEVIAWRNVFEVGHGTPVVNDWTWNDTNTGGFMVELFNPWTSETDAGVRGNRLPVELMRHNSLNESKGYSKSHVIDLAKLSRNESQENGWPVFQMVVVRETNASRDNLLNDPAWPRHESSTTGTNAGNATDAIERVVYLGPRSDKLHKDRYGQLFGLNSPPSSQPQADATTIQPGQCAVVAGPTAPNPAKTDNLILPIMTSATSQSRGVLMALADITEAGQQLGFSDSEPKLPFTLTAGLTEHIEGDATQQNPPPQDVNRRQSARVLPRDTGFGPIGAMICVTGTEGTIPLRMPYHTGSSYDTLNVISSNAYRVLLRRLANPLEHYDRNDNPYITIDSMVFNEQGVIHGSEGNPSDTATITLGSAERGDSLPDAANNIWKQSDSDKNSSTSTYTARGAAAGARQYCGRLNSATAVRWTMGFLPSKLRIPGPGVRDTAPFPWFPWLNRDFATVHELLLVPKSSPSSLLRQHSHTWPFEHLFFGGGAADALVDPSPRLGILEFLTVPSRFADAEQRIAPDKAVGLSQFMEGLGGRPMFLPPHNYLSPFREPGRVNINTLSSKVVWEAMNGGRPCTPYEDEVVYDATGTPRAFAPSEDWKTPVSYANSGNWAPDDGEDTNGNGVLDRNDDENNDGRQTVSGSTTISGSAVDALQSIAVSRRGWAIPAVTNPGTKIAGQFDRITNKTYITSGTNPWFENPFQSGWTAVSGTTYTPARTLLMREAMPTVYTSGSNAKRPEYLFSTNLNNTDLVRADTSRLRGFPYNDPERNPYFHYRDITRLSSLVTPRSNVFAVWVTVGYFTIEDIPVSGGSRQALGPEYGLETGDVVRPKAFTIIDRSIPVGFRPGDSSRVSDLQLLYRFNN